MIEFKPQFLNQIKEQLKTKFPMPSDFALAKDEVVLDIMENIRVSNSSFIELSSTNLNYSYKLAMLCTEKEYIELEKVFSSRITSELYEVGWVYCQYHPSDKRSIDLFMLTCRWMKKHKPDVYDKTLIGRTGLPWDDIYFHSYEIMRIENLSVENFCNKFKIIIGSPFFNNLHLTYLSKCSKETLAQNETLFASLIASSSLELLRPAVRNYTAKISYENMPQLLSDAISYRLSIEDSKETLGLSPNMLQRIRSLRFNAILEDCVCRTSDKLSVYISIAGMIRNVELFTASFFAIDFGNYIVVDSNEWETHAFAYLPQIYAPMLESWKSQNYPENYWPAIKETEIATARDTILGLKKSGVVQLDFAGFDILYTKDLLTITRY